MGTGTALEASEHNAVEKKVPPSKEHQVQLDVMVEAIGILDVLSKEQRRMMGKCGSEPKVGVCIEILLYCIPRPKNSISVDHSGPNFRFEPLSVRIDVEYLSLIPILTTLRKGSPSLMHSLQKIKLVKHDYQVVSKY